MHSPRRCVIDHVQMSQLPPPESRQYCSALFDEQKKHSRFVCFITDGQYTNRQSFSVTTILKPLLPGLSAVPRIILNVGALFFVPRTAYSGAPYWNPVKVYLGTRLLFKLFP